MEKGMTLLAGFTDYYHDAQQAFRRILKAMSEPGTVVRLPHEQRWGDLSPAATAVALTLVDSDTPLWIDPALSCDALFDNLRFHTGARLAEPQQAAFALLTSSSAVDLAAFPAGDAASPELGVTLVLEVASLGGGLPLTLRGPGIAEPRGIAPRLPDNVVRYLLDRPHPFPQGLDFIFTSGQSLLAVPRTTNVEVC